MIWLLESDHSYIGIFNWHKVTLLSKRMVTLFFLPPATPSQLSAQVFTQQCKLIYPTHKSRKQTNEQFCTRSVT